MEVCPLLPLGLCGVPLAALGNLQNEEFVNVESGFQNFVLGLVFPQA